jgi:Secretion system C-terminal sorting domain/Domain of unknown function (DUF4886)
MIKIKKTTYTIFLTFVCFLLYTSTCYSSNDTTKVLFIGNSLTYFYKSPEQFDSIARYEGKAVLVDQLMRGGTAVIDIVSDSVHLDSAKNKAYDYIIMQASNFSLLPELYSIEIEGLRNFMNDIKSLYPNTEFIYKMIWGDKEGFQYAELGFLTYQEIYERLFDGAKAIADSLNVLISPAGFAWDISNNRNPDFNLYLNDNFHPYSTGSYLNACVHYCTIFQEEIVDNDYSGSLYADDAYFLQQIANEAVFNDTINWDYRDSGTIDIKEISDHNLIVYPNPFSSSINIEFKSSISADVEINIFDISGNSVLSRFGKVFENEKLEFHFHGINLPEGIYIYQLKYENEIKSGKIIKY